MGREVTGISPQITKLFFTDSDLKKYFVIPLALSLEVVELSGCGNSPMVSTTIQKIEPGFKGKIPLVNEKGVFPVPTGTLKITDSSHVGLNLNSLKATEDGTNSPRWHFLQINKQTGMETHVYVDRNFLKWDSAHKLIVDSNIMFFEWIGKPGVTKETNMEAIEKSNFGGSDVVVETTITPDRLGPNLPIGILYKIGERDIIFYGPGPLHTFQVISSPDQTDSVVVLAKGQHDDEIQALLKTEREALLKATEESQTVGQILVSLSPTPEAKITPPENTGFPASNLLLPAGVIISLGLASALKYREKLITLLKR